MLRKLVNMANARLPLAASVAAPHQLALSSVFVPRQKAAFSKKRSMFTGASKQKKPVQASQALDQQDQEEDYDALAEELFDQ